MKILTAEEATVTPVLRGRFSRIHGNLSKLKVGEGLVIEKGTDWIGKSPPYRIVNAFSKKHNRQFEKGRLPDGKGWIVKRIS